MNPEETGVVRLEDLPDREIFISLMKKIQKAKGHFTSLDISEGTGMAIGSCRNTIIRFKEKEIIICIRLPTPGNFHEYGRYVLK